MAQWYKNNHRLFREERTALSCACPLLRLVIVGPGFVVNEKVKLKKECAVVHGTFGLRIPESTCEIEFGIALCLLGNYPKTTPVMFCNDPKLPIGNIDRHIMSDGQACLGVHAEISAHWGSGSSIVDFLDRFVAPFLAWQVCFDVNHKPPPWGERSHAAKGVLEFYAEILEREVDISIVDFMKLLARKNTPKGHEPCPCSSGKRLRDCHRATIYKARQRVGWLDAKRDLEILAQIDESERISEQKERLQKRAL